MRPQASSRLARGPGFNPPARAASAPSPESVPSPPAGRGRSGQAPAFCYAERRGKGRPSFVATRRRRAMSHPARASVDLDLPPPVCYHFATALGSKGAHRTPRESTSNRCLPLPGAKSPHRAAPADTGGLRLKIAGSAVRSCPSAPHSKRVQGGEDQAPRLGPGGFSQSLMANVTAERLRIRSW